MNRPATLSTAADALVFPHVSAKMSPQQRRKGAIAPTAGRLRNALPNEVETKIPSETVRDPARDDPTNS